MSSFPILDLILGMVFIYLLLSVISSSIVEIILAGLKARSRILEEWFITIFDQTMTKPNNTQTTLGQAIIDHCAVIGLSSKKAPSYIDAKNFTAALLEKITYNPNAPNSIAKNLQEIITAIENTPVLSTDLKRAFLVFAYETRDTYAVLTTKTGSEIELFRSKLENWYDSTMDRLTGTLKKRYSRPFTFLVAIAVAGFLNADSISIAKFLYSNPEIRTNLAKHASDVVADSTFINRLNQIHATKQDSASLEEIKAHINTSLKNIHLANATMNEYIPLGWKAGTWNSMQSPLIIFTKIMGLLLTTFAIFMGAPFWFDILNKLSNLRSTGPKPPSTTDNDDSKTQK